MARNKVGLPKPAGKVAAKAKGKPRAPLYMPPRAAFLEPERQDADRPEAARAVVIPFGLEASVSYGHGTRHGPAAILKASHALELFDEELWCEPYLDWGVATLRVPKIASPNAAALTQLAGIVETVLDQGRFPLTLGGEHALTAGAIRPFAQRFPDLVVLQLDAHADLRDGYQGEEFSHAAAMRRLLDVVPDTGAISLVQVGIRAISAGEIPFLRSHSHRIRVFWGKDRKLWDIEQMVAPLAGRPVYITFDVDALDPSIMPATGTPEPNGLAFDDALAILKRACEVGTVVGADIVELAPMAGYHAADYTAARLAYKILSYALRRPDPG